MNMRSLSTSRSDARLIHLAPSATVWWLKPLPSSYMIHSSQAHTVTMVKGIVIAQ